MNAKDASSAHKLCQVRRATKRGFTLTSRLCALLNAAALYKSGPTFLLSRSIFIILFSAHLAKSIQRIFSIENLRMQLNSIVKPSFSVVDFIPAYRIKRQEYITDATLTSPPSACDSSCFDSCFCEEFDSSRDPVACCNSRWSFASRTSPRSCDCTLRPPPANLQNMLL